MCIAFVTICSVLESPISMADNNDRDDVNSASKPEGGSSSTRQELERALEQVLVRLGVLLVDLFNL